MDHILDDCQSLEFRGRSQTWGGNDSSYRTRLADSEISQQYSYCESYTSVDDSNLQDNLPVSKSELQPRLLPSKKSSRKNPWGQETYSDLIEAAINSHPNQMATLQQIYEYISKNNKYFAERVDATSSAGWKNSIRHNLSLHDKFVKCPKKNENMKSSLWSINSKCYKRERSNSMDCKRPVGSDLVAKRKMLKEQRRHLSSNANIQTTFKMSSGSEIYSAPVSEESNFPKMSPQNHSSFTYESNDSELKSVSEFSYKENKLNYISPREMKESSREMGPENECYLHEDLQKLDVNSMKHYMYKKDQDINVNQQYCYNFHRAAMEYSRFIADIFIDDME